MRRGAFGVANLELGVPLEPEMVFRLGSITKQFTAAAILLLEEDGKLAVTDSINDYLSDYPTNGHTITVPYAAGSLLSTVDDLARWSAALFGGRLCRPDRHGIDPGMSR